MALNPLEGALLKLRSAEKYTEALEREFDGFLESKPWTPVRDFDPKRKQHSLRVRLVKTVPLEWSGILGDFANNARGALDLVVWQLAIKNLDATSVLREPKSQTQCPILDTVAAWAQTSADKLRDLSAIDRTRIERFQPFKASNPSEDPLALLNSISRIDKHRVIILSIAVIYPSGFTVRGASDIQIYETRAAGFDPSAETGAEIEIASLSLSAPPGTNSVDMNVDFSCYISFDQSTGLPHLNVLDTMKRISARARDFVAEFSPDFP